MASLTRSQKRIVNELFEMETGYVLNFSDRTMAEFFEDEIGVDLEDSKYCQSGGSKAKRLRSFMDLESSRIVVPTLKKLWEYRNDWKGFTKNDPENERDSKRFLDIISDLSDSSSISALPILSRTASHFDLDTVSVDLDRALRSVRIDPEDAVTAACSTVESVCRSIIIELEGELPLKKDVKSLYNAVRKPLGLSPGRSDIDPLVEDDVRKILGGLATVVEGVGALRTHGGDAHGRERGFVRIDDRIASLAVHSSSTITLFLIETWQRKFPSKVLPKHKT